MLRGLRFVDDCWYHAEVVEPPRRGNPVHAPISEHFLLPLDLLVLSYESSPPTASTPASCSVACLKARTSSQLDKQPDQVLFAKADDIQFPLQVVEDPVPAHKAHFPSSWIKQAQDIAVTRYLGVFL